MCALVRYGVHLGLWVSDTIFLAVCLIVSHCVFSVVGALVRWIICLCERFCCGTDMFVFLFFVGFLQQM